MNTRLEKFSEYIKGKKVALIGAGISNMAAVDFLLSRGAVVSVRDKRESLDPPASAELEKRGLKFSSATAILMVFTRMFYLNLPVYAPMSPNFCRQHQGERCSPRRWRYSSIYVPRKNTP